MNWFRQIPFLRILIPFLSGIGLAFSTGEGSISYTYIFLLALCALPVFYGLGRLFSQKYWLLGLDLFLFLFAYCLVKQQDPLSDKWHYSKWIDPEKPVQLIAFCEDVPAEKKQSTKLKLLLREIRQDGRVFPVQGHLLAYIRKHRGDSLLKAGQRIYLEGKLNEPVQRGNPGEFQYKAYLRNKGIYHLLYADSSGYRILAEHHTDQQALYAFVLRVKQRIVDRLKTSGLSPEAGAICAALLTGFDEEIGEDILQSFSHSGTLHVLSVSGLHAGLIYAFLLALFNRIDPYRKHKLWRFALINTGMWSFALLCGLEAPILRAVIMLSFLGLGDLLFGSSRNSQLNILFLAAFVLLCANPFLLKDIGFQLSFTAIFGLLSLEPAIRKVFNPDMAALRWFWQGTSASLAATLSTLPLTLFYFKQFPYWFILANMLVVPAAFLLMVLALGALCKLAWLVSAINLITRGLLAFIQLFNSERFAYAGALNFRLEDAIWLSLLLFISAMAVQMKSYRYLSTSILLLFFWQLHAAVLQISERSQYEVCVFNIKGTTAVAVKDAGQIVYRCSDPESFLPFLQAYNSRHGNLPAKACLFNLLRWKSAQMLILDSSGHAPRIPNDRRTLLLLCNGYRLHTEQLAGLPAGSELLADASNGYKAERQYEQLSRKFAVPFRSLRRQGAHLIQGNEAENW